MAAQIRSKLSPILLAIRQRVMDVMLFPPERVLIVARDVLAQEPQADQFVRIRPRGGPIYYPTYEGGGRMDTRVRRSCSATLRTRMATDEPTQDLFWLNDVSIGHLEKEHALFDALVAFQPTDSDDNWLVTQPLEPKAVTTPEKARGAKMLEWGESTFEFVIHYQLALDQTYQ